MEQQRCKKCGVQMCTEPGRPVYDPLFADLPHAGPCEYETVRQRTAGAEDVDGCPLWDGTRNVYPAREVDTMDELLRTIEDVALRASMAEIFTRGIFDNVNDYYDE